MKKFLLIILLIFLCGIASAEIKENSSLIVSHISQESVTWQYESLNPISIASVDGVQINGFDVQSQNYTLDYLTANSSHRFCLYSEGEINCESASTLPKYTESMSVYLLFAMALVCLIISAWVKPVAWLALMFSLFGILNSLDGSFNVALAYVTLTLISIASLGAR